MIQFHRRLRPVKVISFDLDDTLYDNGPVMQRAEQALVDYLHHEHPDTQGLKINDWQLIRQDLAKKDTDLAGNMTALRLAALAAGLTRCGLPEVKAKTASDLAMAHFLEHRNQVEVAAEVHQLLAALAGRFQLLAISNGNVDVDKIGLMDYFTKAWQPSAKLRGKPTSDMFEAARADLGFNPGELLHIGDHPVSDVQGAARFGAQSVWLNESGLPNNELTWLPTITISHLPALEGVLELA